MSSRRPVVTKTRRARSDRPSSRVTSKHWRAGAAEPGPGGDGGGRAGDELAAVASHFGSAGGQQLRRREAVGAQEALHVRRRGVTWPARVDHRNPAAGAGQDQGGGQTGGAATDNHHVVLVHA